jgi:hypothetical protein
MVAANAVVEDAVKDEARITLARLMQQGNVSAPTLVPMCLTKVINLQQTKCEPHGRS